MITEGQPAQKGLLRLRGEVKRWSNVVCAVFMYLKKKLLPVVDTIPGVIIAALSVGSEGVDCFLSIYSGAVF